MVFSILFFMGTVPCQVIFVQEGNLGQETFYQNQGKIEGLFADK